jgi:hypothetical protein
LMYCVPDPLWNFKSYEYVIKGTLPSYDSTIVFAKIEHELGMRISEFFSELREETVAAPVWDRCRRSPIARRDG